MIESLIAAGAALLVCLINNWYMDRRHAEKEAATIAVISQKLEDLTKQVEKHNGVIERVYQLERDADVLDERIKAANHRIEDLEKEVKK